MWGIQTVGACGKVNKRTRFLPGLKTGISSLKEDEWEAGRERRAPGGPGACRRAWAGPKCLAVTTRKASLGQRNVGLGGV